MGTLLIAESGSTKTDWCLLEKTGDPLYFKTSGINPYLQSQEQILSILEKELNWDATLYPGLEIIFYGAGASRRDQQMKLETALDQFFHPVSIEVQCDLMAAARSLCGDNPGIVCILGTGSNSCFYDGNTIVERQVSLGYIAGDEGSGNYLGKKVLQYYAYNTFDEELKMSFELLFGDDMGAIIKRLYGEPFPNRYLASLVSLLKSNRGHYMVENIIEDGLNDFFHHHVVKYRQSWNHPLFFTGSVAAEFEDVIIGICQQYELELGFIEKRPMENLIKYHRNSL